MMPKPVSTLCALIIFALFVCANPSTSRADARPLAFGLNGISDWSTQHPFLDLMKSARPWIGHLPNQWGGVTFDEMRTQDVFDAQGWPKRIPPGVVRLESLILTDQPPEAQHLSGRYVLTYAGEGTLTVTGRARVITREPGRLVFTYTPGEGFVGIAISATHPDIPIRDIQVVAERHLPAFEAGQLFNPDWMDRITPVETVRFMDWSATNGSPLAQVGEMPKLDDFSYAWRGVPLDVMIALANHLKADPWFTIPHQAEDALVRAYAETVKAGLDPDLTAHVEYSNEVWNFIFEQAHWAAQQAEALWGETPDGWMEFYGFRAASVMRIWSEVFGPETANRLNRVMAVHTGWPGLEQSILTGANATDALGVPPVDFFDAYAVTGYFGAELGQPDILQSVLDNATAVAEQEGRAKGLSRVALREFVKAHPLDAVQSHAAEIVRNGSLRQLTQEFWPYHADVASRHGLTLVMYEGGTHAAALGRGVEDARLVAFLIAFNYSHPVAALYQEALSTWNGLTDSPFNAFVDVAAPSRWGSWGALRHLNDDTPRWRSLRQQSDETVEN